MINCLKCPFLEDCAVSKMTMLSEYVGGVIVPTKVMPYAIEDCPLIKAMEMAKNKAK